jgi:hypothetical protein
LTGRGHLSEWSEHHSVQEILVALESRKVMYYGKFVTVTLALALCVGIVGSASGQTRSRDRVNQNRLRAMDPLNLAVLIQDDLVSQVGNEIGVTRDFIKSLPNGSRVMVGYITSGSLQVRQPFTTDLDKAASSLRIPLSSTSGSPFNPYVEVIEGMKKFESNWSNANAVLLISDGLDTSRGFDSTAAGHTVDIDRAIKEAKKRDIAVFSFYAPGVGLTSQNRIAANYGQSSLNRVSHETGGEAFFQGATGFVTFDSYFARLRETLNRQYAKAY